MKQNLVKLLFIILVLVTFVSCNAADENEAGAANANEIYDQIIEKMSGEQNYSFSGKTSLGMGDNTSDDIIHFEGFVTEGEQLYLSLNISGNAGVPESTMELVKIDNTFKVKNTETTETEGFNEVPEEEKVMYAEFETWSPVYNLEVIKDNTASAQKIEVKDGNEGIRVKIDEKMMKEEIEKQISAAYSTSNQGFTDEEIQRFKDEMGLTDDEIAEMEQELISEMEGAASEMEEMLKTLEVDAFYDIYYDPSTMYIQEMIQNTKTSFNLMDAKIDETMVLTINFSDYGTKKELPTS